MPMNGTNRQQPPTNNFEFPLPTLTFYNLPAWLFVADRVFDCQGVFDPRVRFDTTVRRLSNTAFRMVADVIHRPVGGDDMYTSLKEALLTRQLVHECLILYPRGNRSVKEWLDYVLAMVPKEYAVQRDVFHFGLHPAIRNVLNSTTPLGYQVEIAHIMETVLKGGRS